MKLRGKQKRFLRAKANHLNPIFSIGKNGLSEVWLEEIYKAVDKRELIKVSIQQNSTIGVEDVKMYIEENSDINVVQTIGRILVLFKPSSDDDYQTLSKEVSLI